LIVAVSCTLSPLRSRQVRLILIVALAMLASYRTAIPSVGEEARA